MLRGRRHDSLADLNAPRKEDVVKGFFQQRLVFLPAAFDDRNVLRREGIANYFRDCVAGRRRVCGRLNYHAVARRNRTHNRLQAQLKGIIPGRYDERHAVRFRRNEAFGVKLRDGRCDSSVFYPTGKMLKMEAQFFKHHADFCHIRFKRRFIQIGLHRRNDQRFLFRNGALELL